MIGGLQKILASRLLLCYIRKDEKKHVCGFCGTVPGKDFIQVFREISEADGRA